jgi:general secretion pathway protein J
VTAARRRSAQGGFTLVELLLAITLMSLLLGLAYGGLRAATRASDRGQEVLEDSSRLRITHQFIRRQLNLMLPLAYSAEDPETGGERVVFEGGPAAVQFVGPMPGYLGNGGPHVQRMELVGGDEGVNLVFSHSWLSNFEPERLYDRDPVVLLEGLDDAAFEYLAGDEEGLPAGWVGSWDDPTQLPLAVRLAVAFPEDVQVQWPLLAAAPRLDPVALRAGGAAGSRNYSDAIRDLIQGRREGGQ